VGGDLHGAPTGLLDARGVVGGGDVALDHRGGEPPAPEQRQEPLEERGLARARRAQDVHGQAARLDESALQRLRPALVVAQHALGHHDLHPRVSSAAAKRTSHR